MEVQPHAHRAGHRRVGHVLGRATRSSPPSCAAEGHSARAVTCGATRAITTGRGGGRWRGCICERIGSTARATCERPRGSSRPVHDVAYGPILLSKLAAFSPKIVSYLLSAPGAVSQGTSTESVAAEAAPVVVSLSKGEVVKKIGVIFGMETTFPPALVDKINYMNEPGIQAELASVGEVRMAEPSPYHVIVDRISHDIPFYRGLPEERRALRRDRHQQSVLVERRRQVLQLRAGRQAWRGDSRRRSCCRTSSIRWAPPTAPCATCSSPCRGTAFSATSAFRRS